MEITPEILLAGVAALITVLLFIRYKIKAKPGLTPIELFLVAALIIALLSSILIIFNNSRDVAGTRNTQRSNDTFQIIYAVKQYDAENDFTQQAGISIPLCPTYEEIGVGEGKVDLFTVLVDDYITRIPWDPTDGTQESTGYYICKTDADRFIVSAPHAESGEVVRVSL